MIFLKKSVIQALDADVNFHNNFSPWQVLEIGCLIIFPRKYKMVVHSVGIRVRILALHLCFPFPLVILQSLLTLHASSHSPVN